MTAMKYRFATMRVREANRLIHSCIVAPHLFTVNQKQAKAGA